MSGERAEAASLGSWPHNRARWLREPPGTATTAAPRTQEPGEGRLGYCFKLGREENGEQGGK